MLDALDRGGGLLMSRIVIFSNCPNIQKGNTQHKISRIYQHQTTTIFCEHLKQENAYRKYHIRNSLSAPQLSFIVEKCFVMVIIILIAFLLHMFLFCCEMLVLLKYTSCSLLRSIGRKAKIDLNVISPSVMKGYEV